ncbi:hypothetical protein [Erythrobacter sp. R86502]|uniref:hypothetical protein n=1 Tax=Erythrobacter sp. R86502 TaxID=3093846 RepID=UPI0036D24187
MMIVPMRLACLPRLTIPLLVAIGCLSPGQASSQDRGTDNRAQADQVQASSSEVVHQGNSGKAYLDLEHEQPLKDRASLVQAPHGQIIRPPNGDTAEQISSRIEASAGIRQLSRADLNATLAQLSAAERHVLLQTIEGTDICDDPPQIPAVLALCRDRIETRSQDFALDIERPLSAEEQLLRGGLDISAQPNFNQVIERLARTNAATDDFSNQAIASIALVPDSASTQPKEVKPDGTEGLGEATQALIDAIINQLGGGTP